MAAPGTRSTRDIRLAAVWATLGAKDCGDETVAQVEGKQRQYQFTFQAHPEIDAWTKAYYDFQNELLGSEHPLYYARAALINQRTLYNRLNSPACPIYTTLELPGGVHVLIPKNPTPEFRKRFLRFL